MNTGFKQEQMADFARGTRKVMPMTLLEWYPLKVTKLQDIDALEYGYLRKSQIKGKAPVHVKYYLLFNGTRVHKITLSYRTDEEKLWKDTLKKMLSSIEFRED